MEVRLQGHQGDRLYYICRKTACHFMDGAMASSLRLLCEREPVRRPSTMEPIPRAASWGVEKHLHGRDRPPDLDVQWLWRSGRAIVFRDGPAEELLNSASRSAALPAR